jgi:hypothetical protein
MSTVWVQTERFWTLDVLPGSGNNDECDGKGQVLVSLDMACAYTSRVIRSVLARRPHCRIVPLDTSKRMLQIADFENIEWEPVLDGRHSASCFLVRKGLSRKAQLALQIKRYTSKHPDTILKDCVPFSLIIETWDAFEEMKVLLEHCSVCDVLSLISL